MPELRTDRYQVLIFDCYGTLVDWQSAISSYWQSILVKHDAHVTDEFLLDFHAQWEPVEQEHGDLYRDVLKRVMSRLGERLAFTPSADELEGFVDSLANSQPFDDSVDTLKQLSQHFELAIVSNTDHEIIEKTMVPFELELDYLITAEDTHAYKPSEKMMSEAMSRIGKRKSKLHVAQSLYHDISPANKMGNDSVWINRSNLGDAELWNADAKPTWTFEDLRSFADAITYV